MAQIYKLFSTSEPIPKTHTLETANRVLPLVRRYTEEAVEECESLANRMSFISKLSPQYKALSTQYDRTLMKWVERIHRLGGLAKGTWLVDFDTGNGYLCWVFPEDRVEYFHTYEGGYKTRRKINPDELRKI